MPKRFTASEKWDDPFFFELEPKYKLFWIYLLDKCNHAGIWDVNKKMAEFCIGDKIDWDNIQKIFKDRIEIINNGSKWFIPKFINFQYGVLVEENRAHNSVINILKKEGAYKGLIRGLQGRKDMDMDKDMDKDNKKDNIKNIFKKPGLEEFVDYFVEKGYKEEIAKKAWESYDVANWHDSRGNKIKNWKQKAIQVWFTDENKKPKERGLVY